jgi:hypothetical protein
MIRTKNLVWATTLAGVSLLTACGGGFDEERPAPATPEAIQSFNQLAVDCGADVTLPTSDLSETLEQLDRRNITLDHVSYTATTIYAANGWVPVDDTAETMNVPMSDMRGLALGSGISLGFADGASMGAAFAPRMPSAGITCVRGLNGYSSPAWRGTNSLKLDVTDLPAPAIDGFEWLANYEPPLGMVYFTANKEKVGVPSARICHRGAADSNWSCDVPSVRDQGNYWTFSLSSMSRGTYVFAANNPPSAN